MPRYDRSHSLGLLLAGALLLAACGGNVQTGSETAAPTSGAAVTATQTIVVESRPSAAATSTGAATDTPTSAATATGTGRASQYAALPQAKTPEGYYALGDPNAPIVMNHYSDFL